MNFNDEDAELAEAIRLSLEEAQLRRSTTASASASGASTLLAEQPTPLMIDLTDDMKPVKVEPSAETMELFHRPRVGTSEPQRPKAEPQGPRVGTSEPLRPKTEPQGPRMGTFEPQGPRMGTFGDTSNDNDEEDGDLKKAIALSLEEVKKSLEHQALLFEQLDRAEMERARQERIKRNAPAAAPQSNGKTKKSRLTSPASDGITASTSSSPPLFATPSRPQALSSPSTSTAPRAPLTTSTQSPRTTASSASSRSSVPYPAQYHIATFRNTSIQGKNISNWEVRFEDLLSTDHIVRAMFTTYKLDEEWLQEHIPLSIPQCIVSHWDGKKEEKTKQNGYLTMGKVTYVNLPLNGYGCFHPKLMLLFYPTFCRVVVSSANLVPHDWSELVNTVYVQDFPFLQAPVNNPDDLGEFGSTLYNFLQLMGVPPKILLVITGVDFSSAKVYLLPVAQGTYPVASKFTYGIAQLSKILETKTSQNEEMEIEYQTGSLGRLNLKFLGEFSRASRGVPVRSRYKTNVEEGLPPIKVVFPTERHVVASRLGEAGAGTICSQRHYWDEHSFPKRIMHDYECVGDLKGSMMHSKFVLAKSSVPISSITGRPRTMPGSSRDADRQRETGCAGWIYVGSANFSESAWGTIANKKATPTSPYGLFVSMRNWELGVVYIIETEEEMRAMTEIAQASGLDRASNGSIQSFFGPFPVPYERPLRPYEIHDRPWSF